MQAHGIVVKMPVAVNPSRVASTGGDTAPAPNITYHLRLEEPRPAAGEPPADVTEIGLNRLVGRPVRVEHTGAFTCVRCG
ncbi:MAG TPA: hypothetical protein VJ932_06785, partial [Alkalispirochaeta sp.]|nr:hypothetical protein [Alkalispirochaeta sp.]